MKTLLPAIIVCLFSIQSQAQYTIPTEMYFDVVDTDGNAHSLSDYFDQGKSVFVFEFSNYGSSYVAHEELNLVELYNTYGQGGTNEIVVLFLAGLEFETEADLSNIDYSSTLGPGYSNVSFFTDNPIPIAVLAQNPNTDWYTEEYDSRILCTDLKYVYFEDNTPDAQMARMYDICCVENEVFEPGLSSLTFPYQADCNPQEVDYQINNGTPLTMDDCNIDVSINGIFTETVVYTGPLAGCESENLVYQNLNLEADDIVSFAIAEANELYSNDSIDIQISSVDTVRGQFKMELINPADDYGYGSFEVGQSNYAWVDQTTNWYNQIFSQQLGCTQLHYSGGKFSDGEDQEMLITSLNEDESIQDTIAYHTGNLLGANGVKNVYITEMVTPYLWGYIFEDPNENSYFTPASARISGIEVTHGANLTFSNTQGYYQLPISPASQIQISYDQSTWPVSTTSTSSNYQEYENVYNFGLNQNDPVWQSEFYFNNGIPFLCETPLYQLISLSNTGNQPISQTVIFTHDAQLEVDLANVYPSPISVNGNELTFELEILPFGYNAYIHIQYTPASANLLGSILDTEIDIITSDTDGNVISSDNALTTDSLFCAYDPNDIYGFPLGEGPTGLIAADTDLDYRIRFQNTGNYPAQTVRVTHFVPEELNWESIVPGPGSHEAQIQMNSDTREMTWVFNNINLPDSTSDYEGSNGHVWYKAEMNNLAPGDEIENVAEIYFDQNEAVITNTSLHTISDVVGVETVKIKEVEAFPNPAVNEVKFELGELSDIQSYKVFDKLGRLIQRASVTKNQLTIGISNIETGMYTVVFYDKRNVPIAQSRIVKSN